MSTDPHEYGVPVIFDVAAHSRADAGEALVEILAGHKIPGNSILLDGRGEVTIESWWTLEDIDKEHDRNDNAAGVVVFNSDLDYLLRLLEQTAAGIPSYDVERHQRLMRFFNPEERISWGSEDD